MKKFLISTVLLLLFLGTYIYFSFVDHITHSLVEDSFVINKPYLVVVKSLSTKEALEKTIEENNGKLKYKNWSNFTIEVPKRIFKLKDYKLDGELEFGVEKNDDSLGKLDLKFEQNVKINKDVFYITTNLKSSQKNILLCDKVIEITPDEESGVNVNIKSELKVKKRIPYFFKKIMNEKVEKNNKDSLEQLRINLLNITNNHSSIIEFKRN